MRKKKNNNGLETPLVENHRSRSNTVMELKKLKKSNQTTSASHLLPYTWIPADVVSHPQLQVAHAGHRVQYSAGLRRVEGIEIDLPLGVDQRPQGHRLNSHLLHTGEEVNHEQAG